MKTTRWFALASAALVLGLMGCAGGEFEGGEDESAAADEARSRTARFETFVGRDGQHYFYMMAGNGEKLLRSEGYTTRDGALDAIAALRRIGTDRTRYDLRRAVNGEYYFNVRSTNGQVVATSETYVTRYNATRAISTIVRLITVANDTLASQTRAHFEIFRAENGQYYTRLRAANGEIVLRSEGYTSRSGATNVIESVRRYATQRGAFEVRDSADGQFYFVVKAPNNETIGVSETYVSQHNVARAIDSVIAIINANPSVETLQ